MGIDAQHRGVVTARPGAPAARYDRLSVLLHWLTAAIVLAASGLGLAMVRIDAPLPVAFAMFDLHKSLGLTALALMLARLVWRYLRPGPPTPDGFSPREVRQARVGHGVLRAWFIAVPLAGWAMATVSTLGLPLTWFGLADVPLLPVLSALPLETRALLEPRLVLLHKVLAWAGLGLIASHIGLVWWHARSGHHLLARLSWRR